MEWIERVGRALLEVNVPIGEWILHLVSSTKGPAFDFLLSYLRVNPSVGFCKLVDALTNQFAKPRELKREEPIYTPAELCLLKHEANRKKVKEEEEPIEVEVRRPIVDEALIENEAKAKPVVDEVRTPGISRPEGRQRSFRAAGERHKEEPIVDEARMRKGKAHTEVWPRISQPEGRQRREVRRPIVDEALIEKEAKAKPVVDEARTPGISRPERRLIRTSWRNARAAEEHRNDAGSLGKRMDTHMNVGYGNSKDQEPEVKVRKRSKVMMVKQKTFSKIEQAQDSRQLKGSLSEKWMSEKMGSSEATIINIEREVVIKKELRDVLDITDGGAYKEVVMHIDPVVPQVMSYRPDRKEQTHILQTIEQQKDERIQKMETSKDVEVIEKAITTLDTLNSEEEVETELLRLIVNAPVGKVKKKTKQKRAKELKKRDERDDVEKRKEETKLEKQFGQIEAIAKRVRKEVNKPKGQHGRKKAKAGVGNTVAEKDVNTTNEKRAENAKRKTAEKVEKAKEKMVEDLKCMTVDTPMSERKEMDETVQEKADVAKMAKKAADAMDVSVPVVKVRKKTKQEGAREQKEREERVAEEKRQEEKKFEQSDQIEANAKGVKLNEQRSLTEEKTSDEIQGLLEEPLNVLHVLSETIRSWEMALALVALRLGSRCKSTIRFRSQSSELRPQRIRFKPAQDLRCFVNRTTSSI